MRDGFVYRLSHRELGICGQMSKRQIQALDDAGLLSAEEGLRRPRRAAVIGAFVIAGMSLLTAGRLAAAIAQEANRYDGELHDGLINVDQALAKQRPGLFENRSHDDGLLLYFAARTDRRLLVPGAPIEGDVCFEIVDGRQVFWSQHQPRLTVLDTDGRAFFGELRNVGRGKDADFVPVTELAERASGWISQTVANATSLLRVNCALAIRNGYERLLEDDPKICLRAEQA